MIQWIYYLRLNNISPTMKCGEGLERCCITKQKGMPPGTNMIEFSRPGLASDGRRWLASLVATGIIGSERYNIQVNNGQITYDNRILTHILCSSHPRSQTITSAVTGPS